MPSGCPGTIVHWAWAELEETKLIQSGWVRRVSACFRAKEKQPPRHPHPHPHPHRFSVKQLSFIRSTKSCTNLSEWVGVCRVSVYYLLMLRCLECFIYRNRNSRHLVDMSLEREEIKPVIWKPSYVTTSRVAGVGVARAL